MDIWWSLHLRREPASVPLARRILLGTMASAGVDPDISHEVGVALTEACANAVEHAAHLTDTGEDSGFQVTATIEDGCLRVEITDTGPGFSADPDCASPAPGTAAETPASTRIRPCVTARSRHGRRRAAPARTRPVPVPVRAGRPAAGLDLGPGETAAAFADAGHELPDLCAENGRGLFLIRALMDHVQFRNHPGSGAVVSFDKVLKYRDRPLLHAS
ncbi:MULTISPECIES: ATP-binding protein [Streptacidiphilus]|uniref:ATP-binding protein n=2 Tax=Streptacidiphilus TaxID=228398 RepID=A0ABV6UGP9_9ACTN|nr:ATP-binding protein [Streptacidiphilus jeojiense]